MKKLEVKRRPADDLEYEPAKRQKNIEECREVKLEENTDNDIEATYGELLMMKKLQAKKGFVKDLEADPDKQPKIIAECRKEKLEEEFRNYEPLPLELTLIEVEEAHNDHSDTEMLN